MNIFDDLNVQLPGRMATLEILIVLLLREKPAGKRRQMLAQADQIISTIEADIHAAGIGQAEDYALKVFGVARQSLDKLRDEALRPG